MNNLEISVYLMIRKSLMMTLLLRKNNKRIKRKQIGLLKEMKEK